MELTNHASTARNATYTGSKLIDDTGGNATVKFSIKDHVILKVVVGFPGTHQITTDLKPDSEDKSEEAKTLVRNGKRVYLLRFTMNEITTEPIQKEKSNSSFSYLKDKTFYDNSDSLRFLGITFDTWIVIFNVTCVLVICVISVVVIFFFSRRKQRQLAYYSYESPNTTPEPPKYPPYTTDSVYIGIDEGPSKEVKKGNDNNYSGLYEYSIAQTMNLRTLV